MRSSWLVVTAGILAACGNPLTIAPADDVGPTADGGPAGDGGTPADGGPARDGGPLGDGSIPGEPCPESGNCLLVTSAQIASLAVLDVYVYYTQYDNQGAIWRVRKEGGNSERIVTGQPLPNSLFATDVALYWLNEGDSGVARLLPASTSPAALKHSGSLLTGGRVAAFGSKSYWTAPALGMIKGGTLHFSDDFGQDQTVQSSLDEPTAVAVDSGYVYIGMKNGFSGEQVYRYIPPMGSLEAAPQLFTGIRGIALSASTGAVAVAAEDVMGRMSSWGSAFEVVFTGSASVKGVGVVRNEINNSSIFLTSDGAIHKADDGVPGSVESTVPGCSDGRAIAQDGQFIYLACMTSIWRVPQ